MKYLIGLDIGTSSVKGVLMTEDGKVKKKAHGSFKYTQLENGGLEIDTDAFVTICIQAIKELASGATDGDVCGVCASSASGNLVVLDNKFVPVTPIINWQDKRVENEAREVLGDLDKEDLYQRIGWPFNFKTFPLAQLCFIKKHSPGLLEECGMVCMSTEYLYYVLTGKWGISASAGTPFYLIDQQTGEYIPELLQALNISKNQVPPVMPCGKVLGCITPQMAEICGLDADTPIVLGSFDHPSAARGVGILKEGEMLLSCGTSWVAFLPVASREIGIKAKVLVDPFLYPEGCPAVMASVASVSARIKMYVNRYIDDSENAFSILSGLAQKSEPGAGGLLICPTEEPDDERILSFSKENIARAIMEGTVNLLKEKLDRLKSEGITAKTAVMVGGPSEDPMWAKLIEEMCGISVKVTHGASAGAVGAAVLAGIGCGLYNDEADTIEKFKMA